MKKAKKKENREAKFSEEVSTNMNVKLLHTQFPIL
jgi:hypothetical protein